MRFLQLLDAPTEELRAEGCPWAAAGRCASGRRPKGKGMAIQLQQVRVEVAEQVILHSVDLTIEAGSQIAIVGPSGAGKSTLVGLLLGWHYPVAGQILVDGALLDYAHLQQLRSETAWVDPTIQLWNRSFLIICAMVVGKCP